MMTSNILSFSDGTNHEYSLLVIPHAVKNGGRVNSGEEYAVLMSHVTCQISWRLNSMYLIAPAHISRFSPYNRPTHSRDEHHFLPNQWR